MNLKITKGGKRLTEKEAEEFLKSPEGQLVRFHVKRLLGCLPWVVGISAFLFVMLLWAIELMWG